MGNVIIMVKCTQLLRRLLLLTLLTLLTLLAAAADVVAAAAADVAAAAAAAAAAGKTSTFQPVSQFNLCRCFVRLVLDSTECYILSCRVL